MKKIALIAGIIVVVLIAAGLVISGNYRDDIRSAEPQYSGSIRLSGLQDSVVVRYDQDAVPTIQADNQQDLFYAAGYVAASERLWQMEFTRLTVQGRLAEFLGEEALQYDKFLRTIGLNRLGAQLQETVDENTLTMLQAYTDGINRYIDSHRENLPVEYQLLEFEPEPWTVEQSLGIVRLMAWELNIAWHLDIVIDEIFRQVGEQKGQDIFPEYPADGPRVLSDRGSMASNALDQFLSIDKAFRQFRGIQGTHIGSNSWVVSGSRSQSGMPLLANDPHLGYSQPSRWYEMHLQAPGINVSGATIPGLPFVVIGRNDSIAWGLTSAMVDDADFFEEVVEPENPYLYLHNGQWLGMDSRKEIFYTKEGLTDSIVVRTTRHGPIVSDIHPVGRQLDRVISMRWTGHEMSDEVTAIYQLNMASDWGEFTQAVNQFHVPGQNIVYADISGNIGLRIAAKIPVRRTGLGNVVHTGTENTYEWVRFLTPDQLPGMYNPAQGYIATANNKIMEDNQFAFHISNLYEPPSRIERIEELLATKPVHSVADFKQYQMDVLSPHAREVTGYILDAFEGQEIEDEYIRGALTWLEKWDFTMSPESIPATLFNVTFLNLLENTYLDEMGELLFTNFLELPNAPIRNITSLLERPLNPWWDDTLTNGYENRYIILRRSLTEAIGWLREQYGRSMINWRWGRLHTVTFPHALGSGLGLADRFIGLNLGPYESGGSGTTVNNGEFFFTDPYHNVLGPSIRQIANMADPDSTFRIIYSGQSGHPMSPHYSDQVAPWLNGEYHMRPLSDEGVLETTENTLVLTP